MFIHLTFTELQLQIRFQPISIRTVVNSSGHGLEGISDEDNWHGEPLGAKAQAYIDHWTQKIVNLRDNGGLKPHAPKDMLDMLEGTLAHPPHLLSQQPEYKHGDKIATRAAYGMALQKMGKGTVRFVKKEQRRMVISGGHNIVRGVCQYESGGL